MKLLPRPPRVCLPHQSRLSRLSRLSCLSLLAMATLLSATAQAQQTKVAIGISGWTGFAPLTLVKEAGLFKKHGLDVDIKKIPQKDRHLAIA